MSWWGWIVGGAILLGAELAFVNAQFYLVFIGSAAILAVATATAEGLRRVGGALSERGGIEAMQLRIGEEYVRQFGKMAKESTTLVVPSHLSDLASVVTMATSIIRKTPPGDA